MQSYPVRSRLSPLFESNAASVSPYRKYNFVDTDHIMAQPLSDTGHASGGSSWSNALVRLTRSPPPVYEQFPSFASQFHTIQRLEVLFPSTAPHCSAQIPLQENIKDEEYNHRPDSAPARQAGARITPRKDRTRRYCDKTPPLHPFEKRQDESFTPCTTENVQTNKRSAYDGLPSTHPGTRPIFASCAAI